MNTMTSGLVPLWSNSTAPQFIPVLGPVALGRVATVMWQARFTSLTEESAMKVMPVAQFSRDGIDWPSVTVDLRTDDISLVSGSPDAWLYGTTPFTFFNQRAYVRYGFRVQRSSGSDPVFARVQFQLWSKE